MFVKRVEQFSGYEADLVVSDGQYNIKCHFSCFPPLRSARNRTYQTV